jgi:hypothetical protein
MNTPLLSLLLAVSSAVAGLDSAGRRAPRLHLPEVAPSWTPALLKDRLILEIGDGAAAEAAREALPPLSAAYTGAWTADFAKFRSQWPRSLANRSWPIAVAAFWRSRGDEEPQARPGLQSPSGPAMLQEWVRWMESTDPKVRLALADLTSRELSTPGALGATDLAIGESLVLDLSRSRFDGPLRVRTERILRRGLSFQETRPYGSVQIWTPPVAKPVWSSKPWMEPGLFRVVWEARGFYQQALVRVGRLEVFSIPTDSGMLVWADKTLPDSTRIVWMDRRGKVDSVAADLSRPLHIGFPVPADSGLVGIVSGTGFATLRLRRPRPSHHEALGWAEERDRIGRPLLVPSRTRGRAGWVAASLLDREVFEKGDWMRVSGWMRRMDAYGRPDSSRGDSLRWSVEPFFGPATHRWVKPDAAGRWTDSIRVQRKGRVHVTALAAGGAVFHDAFCEIGSVYRVRDADRSCLESRPPDSGLSSAPDTIRLDLRTKSTLPALLVLTQGRALDWRFATDDNGLQAKIPFHPTLAAGASVLLVSSASGGWNGWRQALESEPSCTESRFPLGLSATLPAVAKKGSPLPPLRVVARTGPPPAMTVSLRLVPDEFAASLKPLCQALGRGWAASEVYTGDAAWRPLGLGEPPFQSYDQRRDPDPFVRIGVRTQPPLCIACGPWTGSWEARAGKAEVPSGCGWAGQDEPCLKSGKIPAERILVVEAPIDSTGSLVTPLSWPKWPGRWRLQAWGIDAQGRVLAWERTVRVE